MFQKSGTDFSSPMSYGNTGGGRSSFDLDYGMGGDNYGFNSAQDSPSSFVDYPSFPSGNGRSGGNDFYVGGADGGFGGGMMNNKAGGGFKSGGGFGGNGGQRGGTRGRGGMGRGAAGGPGRGATGGAARGGLSGRGTTRGGMGGSRGAGNGSNQGAQKSAALGGDAPDAGVSKTEKVELGYLQDHAGHFPDEYWCKVSNYRLGAYSVNPNNPKPVKVQRLVLWGQVSHFHLSQTVEW